MSLGSFRFAWQPLRPFIAGTKITNYVMMKHGEEEEEKKKTDKQRPLKNAKMIHIDSSLSPPPTPVHLSSAVGLVASRLTTTSISSAATPPRSASPDFSYDGVTFTARVTDLFSVAPSSPPDSDYDNSEISLFTDDQDDLDKFNMVVPSSASGRCSSLGSVDGYINSELAEAAIQAVQSEPYLATAVNSVLQTGSVTPLIKEELKCTIQTKRMRNGKGELEVRSEKKSPEKLTPEEKQKRDRRRERNKLAAQKCRDNKSQRAAELTQEIDYLEDRNGSLRTEMKQLNQEIQQLRDMLVKHDKSTQCGNMLAHVHKLETELHKMNNTERDELPQPSAKRQKTRRGAQKHHH